MFTKYTFRIQKPNVQLFLEKPLYYLGVYFGQMFTTDVDDISDSFGDHFQKFGNWNAFTGLVDDLPIMQATQNLYSMTK